MTQLSATPDAEALAESLHQLGFTGYEARIYVKLLKAYPVTAYEIAKQTGLPRANVYNALATLERKAAVQPVNENPVRYVPVDPRQLLGRIQRETATRCDSLVEQLAAIQEPVSTEFVWTLSGDAQIHAKMSAIIQQARKHVWIKGGHHLLKGHLGELLEAAGRGVNVMVILFGDAEELKLYEFGPTAKAYLHEGSGGKVGLSEWLVTMTRDFEEALTATTGAAGHGVFTRSRPVVTLAESLIRHEIYLAEIFSQFATELESRFGPALYGLRRKYLPEEQVRDLALRTGQALVEEDAKSGEQQLPAAA